MSSSHTPNITRYCPDVKRQLMTEDFEDLYIITEVLWKKKKTLS